MSSLYASTPVCLHCLQSWQGRTQTEPPQSLSSWTGSRGERERASEIAQVQSASCSTSLFPASSTLQYSSIFFFIPPLVDASLSSNSLITLSLCLSLSHLCLYGLTLQLNRFLFGWDRHKITVLVRRWGFLSLRGEERMLHALKSRWREQ